MTLEVDLTTEKGGWMRAGPGTGGKAVDVGAQKGNVSNKIILQKTGDGVYEY
jgi:hypothetical protein